MNTGLFRLFRFECWAWSKLILANWDYDALLYTKQVGLLHLCEERIPAPHNLSIGEAWVVLGPISFLLGRGFLGNE